MAIAGELARARAEKDPLAPWPVEVIVSSSGIARAVTRELLQQIPSGVAGLRLQTLEELARRIVNGAGEYPRPATELERRLAMRTAARAESGAMFETRGITAMLDRSYRDMRDAGLTVPLVEERVRKTRRLRDRDRTRSVLRVWTSCERLIGALGAVDPASLLLRAADLIERGARIEPQIIAGFYDMTGAQRRLIDALEASGQLLAQHVPVAHPPSERLSIHQPAWTIDEGTTREDEVRRVCLAIGGLLRSGVDAASIGIVARSLDAYDQHLLERFAAASGFTTGSAPAIPLTAHRIGRAIASMLRIRDRGFPRGEVIEILRAGFRTRRPIRLDAVDVATRKAWVAAGTSDDLRARTFDSPVVDDYVSALDDLEQAIEHADVRLFERAANLFRIESETDVAVIDRLEEIAAVFRRAERWKRKPDVAALLDALEHSSITAIAEPPADGRPEIWAGDVMRFRGRTFAHLFAIRMQDDLVPQRRSEDPLFPDGDRLELGMPPIGNGRDEEDILFRFIVDGATTALHFSYAASDGFGRTLRPSQMLKSFAIEQRPSERALILESFPEFVARFAAPAVDRAGSGAPPHPARDIARQLQSLVQANTRGVFDGYVRNETIIARAREALARISPTHLEDFGECPQKFLLRRLLGVEDLEDPDLELQTERRDKGNADHTVLEQFYRGLTSEELERAAVTLPVLDPEIAARLDGLVDATYDALEAEKPPFNRALRAIERRGTKRLLRRFVAADIADLTEQGLEPAFFEYSFGTQRRGTPDREEAFALDASGVRLSITGIIDRIDRGGNRHRVVDYKSGKALRQLNLSEKIGRGVRLQLALYAMAIAGFFDLDPAQVSGTIKPIVPGEGPRKYAFELSEHADGLRATLDSFVSAILGGNFPAYPDRDWCTYCPVGHSCRTHHDQLEKREVLRAGDARALLRETP